MRILVGMPEVGARGGPAACEPPFTQELRRLGHQVEEEIYAYADSTASLSERIIRVRRTARCFREHLNSRIFDLVHINTSFDTRALLRDAFILPRLRRSGARIFLKFHGSDETLLTTRNPLLTASRRRVFSCADGIGALSSEERASFLRGGVPDNKLFLVKNVIEPIPCAPASNELPTFLFISRFIPAKGLLDVVRAGALLRDRSCLVNVLCIGDGPARGEAEREVDRLNLRNQVRFLGHIPEAETDKYYSTCSGLLFPTYHFEGFPIAIFKAAAAGLPIVTTRIRAAADYLKEPDNCLWVEPQRPDLLAERVIELLARPELRESMARNNRVLVEQFAAHPVAQEYLTVYNRLINQIPSANGR